MAEADGAKILEFAKTKLKTQVGRGECFDLADAAIKALNAKSADAYGEVKEGADYVWGEKLANVISAAPGDILQFKDYAVDVSIETSISLTIPGEGPIDLGGDIDTSQSYSRPHHTAIVVTGPKDNQVTVSEQNVERGAGKTKERKVDFGSNYTKSPDDKVEKSQKSVTINRGWGEALKAKSNDPQTKAAIDALVKKYDGKSFQADVTTTTKIAVSGEIKAYRVQMP